MDGFTPKEYLSCVLHVRVFMSFAECLYIRGRDVGADDLFASHLEVLSFILERFWAGLLEWLFV